MLEELEESYEMFKAIDSHIDNIDKSLRLLMLIEKRPDGMKAEHYEDCCTWLIRQVRHQISGSVFLARELTDCGKEGYEEEMKRLGFGDVSDESYGEDPRVGNTGVQLTENGFIPYPAG